jgi:hypothetical protein
MAAIVRQRLLRTGDLQFSASTASDVDQWLVVVDDRIDKVGMAELWVSVGGNPVPKGTLKQLGSNYLICDHISCSSEANQGYIWKVNVHWKEIEEDQPDQQSAPTPNSGSLDPEDWSPTWQRRTVVIHEPAVKAKYLSGYSLSGGSSTWMADNEDAAGKSPLVNSALQPLVETPEHRRRMWIWTFKWLRATVPASLVNAEGKINDRDFTVNFGGRAFLWKTRTALLDSVNLSKMRWGNVNLVEITVEVAHDPEGWVWLLQDKGTARRAAPGDPGVIGTLLDAGKPMHAALKDVNGKAIQDPIFLNGDGQPAAPDTPVVYGEWLDFDELDFDGVGLLGELGS